ncbi:permease-like cell division protein FtsX [Heyndrickxia acidicola]|uniref:Cell division protein FtsX n=1 Tax=Heyndrickxia acidicola TaxID=209389 RepID=A0ABU6MI95_9BACI|nr:permease-like cell division protein FtsX [Heyndrickxia acidicola]MED1204401.1 permease-like cell division protein FtsX [Heyndrickxia acidicola]
MKIRTLKRHFRESIKSLGRNGWMMFASASAVTITLLLVGVFFVIMMNMNKIATDIEKDVEIRVHIDLTANPADENALKAQLESMPEVQSVTFSSKQKELQNLVQTMGSDFKLYQQDNPLYDVFIVKTKNPTDTPKAAAKIQNMNYVQSAIYGKGKVENLFKVLTVARNVGIVLIIGLLLTAMFLISNTIKITIFARRHELEIMKLVGATNWFVRWPFVMEGLWLGILGSILPITIISVGYTYLYKLIAPKLHDQLIQMLSANPFVWEVSILLLIMGMVIGVWGSSMSIRRYLKV